MKIVQDALVPTNIPVFAGVWKSTASSAVPPDQYLVYSTMRLEAEHWDDENHRDQIYIYLNLWSADDPTEAVRKVRAAMRAAGFAMVEETDHSANDSAYDENARQYLTSWTWVCWEAESDGA